MQFPNLFGTHSINSKWQIRVLWMVTVPSSINIIMTPYHIKKLTKTKESLTATVTS